MEARDVALALAITQRIPIALIGPGCRPARPAWAGRTMSGLVGELRRQVRDGLLDPRSAIRLLAEQASRAQDCDVITRRRARIRCSRWAVVLVTVAIATPGCRNEPAPAARHASAGRASPSTSVTRSPADLEAVLEAARKRFRNAPPSVHGTYEFRSEGETITYELWVDWPAFRISFTAKENEGPTAGETHEAFTIATLDGKRFGVRDPLASEPYVTRSFGEAMWILGPIHIFLGDLPPWCGSEGIVGTEQILDRSAIQVRCSENEAFDTWIDEQTGLALRQVLEDPSREEGGWSGFVELEFDPALDETLFDPASV